MKKRVFFLFLALVATLSIRAEEISKTTYTFAHKESKPLLMDLYSASEQVQPCLVYVFGGAFVTGSRAEPTVIEVYEYFVRRGWKVVAIDYRLGLKPLIDNPDEERSLLDFRSMLVDAINWAAEDLIDATAYLLSNAETLGIDPTKIVTLGSSAGAIAAVQAEWAICNSQPIANVLPEDFNYAGVISMAGAICAKGRKLEWEKSPCPIMLFHGNADRNVPYGKQSLFGVTLFGSEVIAASLDKLDSPYWFYDANNVDHNLSWRPMYVLRDEMEKFTEQMVFGGKRVKIHQWVDDVDLPEVEHDFGMKVYIETNFTPNQPRGADAVSY